MTNRIDRRHFLMGTSALVAAGVAGVMPTWAQASSLRMTFWGGQTRADRTYAVTDLYTAEKGVAIEGEFVGWNDYWTKVATHTAGGNAPDLIQMDYRYIVEYAKRNAIAPLDEFVGIALQLDDYDADQVNGGKVDGKLYGVSLGANSAAMIVNQTAFESAGVQLPGASTTYDDLMAMGEAFNAKGEMRLLGDYSGSEPVLENWLRQRGKALYTADGAIAFDENDIVEWFSLWATMREAEVIVTPEDQALDTGAMETKMITLRKAALVPANSNELVAYQAITQDVIGLANFPRIAADAPGGHYRKPAMFFSVAQTSTKKKEAAEFLSFFVNDLDAAALLGLERGIPCSASVREALAPTLDNQSQIALNYVANLGDLLGALPPSPPAAAGEVSTILNTLSQEVAFGMKSPEQAGPELVNGAVDVLGRG